MLSINLPVSLLQKVEGLVLRLSTQRDARRMSRIAYHFQIKNTRYMISRVQQNRMEMVFDDLIKRGIDSLPCQVPSLPSLNATFKS